MKTVFLIIFIITTSIHLYASAKKNKKLRNITKPFILASLLGYYLCACAAPMPSVILALIFSWLGDVLLIPNGVKWFTVGGISFMISHFFFALSYAKDINFQNAMVRICLLIAAVFFFIVVTVIFKKLKKHLPKALFYPMYLYLLINGTMNCFAIIRYASVPETMSLITCVGAILFFISDACLFFVRFNKDGKQNHFLVMLTYSIGELLIVLGLI